MNFKLIVLRHGSGYSLSLAHLQLLAQVLRPLPLFPGDRFCRGRTLVIVAVVAYYLQMVILKASVPLSYGASPVQQSRHWLDCPCILNTAIEGLPAEICLTCNKKLHPYSSILDLSVLHVFVCPSKATLEL